ncbi:response regulator [Rhizobiales bacterium]|uniref:DNA-binding response regulator n=1 Tax=Hongsoonwoonella zoysiae TaxID=2821844 RepID=UPI001560998B|nr:response regulator [Hongsoonwoonella zoysiae]NRG19955.1 response regulator [Hongsoonwoonella zoysiae]
MRPTIMFIDDEIRILNALQRQLSSVGKRWSLCFETDPRDALDTAIELQPDVIVCDMRMPGMDGVQLLSTLRARGVDTCAIMLTGSSDLEVATAAINVAGVFRFFTKPCSPEELMSGIEAALADRERRRQAMDTFAEFKAFDLVSAGIFVFGESEQPLYTNATAQRMLQAGQSLRTAADGSVKLLDDDRPIDLGLLVEKVRATGEAVQLGLARKDAMFPLSATLRPQEDSGYVVLIATDPEEVDPPCSTVIGDVLKLTRSEASLVYNLALGLSVAEAAEACGLSVQSARTYLKRIYQKTRTNRQSDLMRLVYSVFPNHLLRDRRAIADA